MAPPLGPAHKNALLCNYFPKFKSFVSEHRPILGHLIFTIYLSFKMAGSSWPPLPRIPFSFSVYPEEHAAHAREFTDVVKRTRLAIRL